MTGNSNAKAAIAISLRRGKRELNLFLSPLRASRADAPDGVAGSRERPRFLWRFFHTRLPPKGLMVGGRPSVGVSKGARHDKSTVGTALDAAATRILIACPLGARRRDDGHRRPPSRRRRAAWYRCSIRLGSARADAPPDEEVSSISRSHRQGSAGAGVKDQPPTFRYVSSTCQQSPTTWRRGRAASANSGANRWTHRYTVMWSTSMPRSA